MDDWLNGDAVLTIDFIQTYDTDKNNKKGDCILLSSFNVIFTYKKGLLVN